MQIRYLSIQILGICCFFSSMLNAQIPTPPIVKDSLYSNTLKEGRALEIVLPVDYEKTPERKYEVLYVTDGEWNTRIASNIQQFLQLQFMPPVLIVSIPNIYVAGANHRDLDFTPTKIEGWDRSGGADHFISFLKDELRPYIDKNTGQTESIFCMVVRWADCLAYILFKRPYAFLFLPHRRSGIVVG